jgi:hypothetical protein
LLLFRFGSDGVRRPNREAQARWMDSCVDSIPRHHPHNTSSYLGGGNGLSPSL